MDGRQARCFASWILHRPLRAAGVQKAGIQPKSYLNQNVEVITTNFRAGKLDAAVIWEPTASKIVAAVLAKRVASGEDFNALDGGLWSC